MKNHWILILLMAVLLVGIPAKGQPVLSETTEQAEDASRSWFSRILHRYFGQPEKDPAKDKGEARNLVEQYTEYSGWPIEVIIVYQVLNFEEGWDDEKGYSFRTLTNLTAPLRAYTRDSVVRDYLTFKRGQTVDPFSLADSERMLRNLEFISDARILLVPLEGESESVAVVVEVKDRWPFGIDATVVDENKYSLKLYSSNVAGLGVDFSNRILHSTEGEPSWGYAGSLRKENFGGSFLDAEIGFEDSYRRLERKVLLERRLVYPELNYLGGVLFDQAKKRDLAKSYDPVPSKYELSDIWAGKTIRLYDHRKSTTTARSILVPAATAYRKIFTDRPHVSPDTNRQYHHRKGLLGGLTFSRLKNYKTSYLFKDGEVEDFPSGYVVKGSAGYEIGEFEDRTVVALETMAISIRNRGDIVYGRFDAGGYLKNQKMEEGLIRVGAGYFSRLLGEGAYRHRFYTSALYTLGLSRYPLDSLYLDGNTGIRGLAQGEVAGNQRLVGNLEYRLFTPMSVLGFRLSFQLFSDVGLITGENDPIFKKKVYTATGIGIRLRNPELVLPTVQVRFSLLSNVDDSGVAFGVKIGNVGGIGIQLPGVKPATISYQ